MWNTTIATEVEFTSPVVLGKDEQNHKVRYIYELSKLAHQIGEWNCLIRPKQEPKCFH
jgi:hypothetical protein